MSKESSFLHFNNFSVFQEAEVGYVGTADEDPSDPKQRGERGENFAKTGGSFGRQVRRQAVFPGHHQYRRNDGKEIVPPKSAEAQQKPVEQNPLTEVLSQELRRVLTSVPSKNKEFIPFAIEALKRALQTGNETFVIQAVLKGNMRIPDIQKAQQLLDEIKEAIEGSELLQQHLACGHIKTSFTAPCSIAVTIKKG